MEPSEDVPLGADQDLNEAIKIMLSVSGFETDDPEAIKMVEMALRWKLRRISANAHFCAAGQEGDQEKVLSLQHLKRALKDDGIRIDRPEFILEHPQSKMSTRRSKTSK